MATPFSISFGKFHENPFCRSKERLSHILWRTKKNRKKNKTKNKKKQKETKKHL